MKYLVNAFSLNMLKELSDVTLTLRIKRLTAEEFCEELRGEVVNAVGHASTVNVINTLCATDLLPSRIEVKLHDGDELIVFQLRTRLPEGKVLTAEEVGQLLEQKQVEFIKVKVTIQ